MAIEKEIRIVSDGTLLGTRVIHVPSGAALHVSKVTFEVDAARFGEQALMLTIPRQYFEVYIAAMATLVPLDETPLEHSQY